jgi:hypothetical protein
MSRSSGVKILRLQVLLKSMFLDDFGINYMGPAASRESEVAERAHVKGRFLLTPYSVSPRLRL